MKLVTLAVSFSTWNVTENLPLVLRLNVVAPGLTETRLAETMLRSEAIREAAVGKIPLKRINQPNEISSAIEWLLCDAPDNFTGQVLHLDGGMSRISG